MAQPYRTLSEAYFEHGVRAFPVYGKRPCITNYNRSRPGRTTITRWAAKFDGANLGLLTGRSNLVVIDVDDPSLVDFVLSIAGPTPLRVRTRRGEHLYYRDPEGQFIGASRPDGHAYDIKGSGSSDFILIPGSVNDGIEYEIVGYDGDDVVGEYVRRLRDLPALATQSYSALTPRIRVLKTERWKRQGQGSALLLPGAQIPVGQRNSTLFLAACRDAHEVRRGYDDGDVGLRILADRIAGYNDALCELPLSDEEVGRIASSAWTRTLSGENRPPRRSSQYVGGLLKRTGKNVRALALWGWLTQEAGDLEDFELSPGRLAGLIPGWKRHDGDAAIRGLIEIGVLVILEPGGKGRGRAGRYRLAEVFVSDISFSAALDLLNGDAAAAALLAFVVDAHGPGGQAVLSAGGMSEAVGGPFGRWTKVGIRKAYDRLAEAGLLERVDRPRVGLKRPRALFQIRATNVLKMPGIVPVDIHAPPILSFIPSARRSGE